jgi:hypothetical protein
MILYDLFQILGKNDEVFYDYFYDLFEQYFGVKNDFLDDFYLVCD